MGPRTCFVKMTLEIECRVLNDLKNDFFMCSGVVSPHGLKNDVYFMCSVDSPHGLKNDECYMRSALVSRHGFKNDVYFIAARLFGLMAQRTTYISCVTFVSPHGLKNDECYICSALVSRHGCTRDIFSVSRELTSGESDRLLPGRTVSIGSDRVRLPTSSTPLFPVNLLLPVPLIKRLAPISGSGRNRTQSACW